MKALQMEKQPSCWVETGVLVEWKNINPDMDYGIAPMVKKGKQKRLYWEVGLGTLM